MILCYDCFIKLGGDPLNWDLIPCDDTKRRKCERCGLVGLYVRLVPIKKEDNKKFTVRKTENQPRCWRIL